MMVQSLGLSLKAELAHRGLFDWSWSEGRRPPDHGRTLAIIARCTPEEWPEVKQELQRAGWRVTPKGDYHAVARAVLCRARTAHQTHIRAGQYGARVRWDRKAPSTLAQSDADAECPSYSEAMATPMASPKRPQYHERLTSKRTINEKDIKQLNGELISLSGSPPLQEKGEENRFLNELVHALGEFDQRQPGLELAKWGGWWRLRYREGSGRAWRVLAELTQQRAAERFGTPLNEGAAVLKLAQVLLITVGGTENN